MRECKPTHIPVCCVSEVGQRGVNRVLRASEGATLHRRALVHQSRPYLSCSVLALKPSARGGGRSKTARCRDASRRVAHVMRVSAASWAPAAEFAAVRSAHSATPAPSSARHGPSLLLVLLSCCAIAPALSSSSLCSSRHHSLQPVDDSARVRVLCHRACEEEGSPDCVIDSQLCKMSRLEAARATLLHDGLVAAAPVPLPRRRELGRQAPRPAGPPREECTLPAGQPDRQVEGPDALAAEPRRGEAHRRGFLLHPGREWCSGVCV